MKEMRSQTYEKQREDFLIIIILECRYLIKKFQLVVFIVSIRHVVPNIIKIALMKILVNYRDVSTRKYLSEQTY